MLHKGLFVIFLFNLIQYSASFENLTTTETNTTDVALLPLVEETTNATINGSDVEDEEDEFSSCLAFELSPDEYTMFENGTAYVANYKKYYDPSSYILDGDLLTVCAPIPEIEKLDPDAGSTAKFALSFTYITRIGLGISMFCLVLHLIVFFIVPDMRNLPGYNLASLCFSLLFGYIFFMVAHAESVENSGIPCICAAIGMQFFMLSSFLWMSTMAFDVFRSLLKATGKLRLVSRKFSCKKYSIYCLYSWGTPLLFVIVTLILDNVEEVPEHFRPMIGSDICWFRQKTPLILLFAAPVMTIVISNVVLFGISAYIIFANRMRADQDEVYKSQLKRNFLIYSRLATIMGLAWFVAIFANLINATWLWYIYILINTLQGFFIFLAFTCTQKVRKHLEAYFKLQKRKISVQSTSPTFQSYWNTGLSLEHDLDFASEANMVKIEKV